MRVDAFLDCFLPNSIFPHARSTHAADLNATSFRAVEKSISAEPRRVQQNDTVLEATACFRPAESTWHATNPVSLWRGPSRGGPATSSVGHLARRNSPHKWRPPPRPP